MPYVRRDKREAAFTLPMSAGELNFCLVQHTLDYIERQGPLDYALLNEVMGVLSCVGHELYRRMAWYEDSAIAKNGDLAFPKRARTQRDPHWAEADHDVT